MTRVDSPPLELRARGGVLLGTTSRALAACRAYLPTIHVHPLPELVEGAVSCETSCGCFPCAVEAKRNSSHLSPVVSKASEHIR
jgi:hypothetical protein